MSMVVDTETKRKRRKKTRTQKEVMEFGNENARVKMEDDRISNLPDDIIHHILSFNDTKSAVQTSVLSSRWKLIWTTLPHLEFSTKQFRTLRRFSKFMKRALSQNVQRVSIFACEPKAKEKKDNQMPPFFFTSQSLKHLSMKTDLLGPFPFPQLPWDFPALTTIELKHVRFHGRNTGCLDLFSKCVSLTNLTLENCSSTTLNLKVVKILCPRLLSLRISCCKPSNFEISAPNLSSFYYRGWELPIISTGGLNSLEEVNLHMDITSYSLSNEEKQRQANDLMNMLGELRNAKFVILYGSVIEFLSKNLDLLEHQLSPFSNLKHLRIEGLEIPGKHAQLGLSDTSHMTDQVVNYLLNSSPTATVSKEFQEGMYPDRRVELLQRIKQRVINEGWNWYRPRLRRNGRSS